MSFQKNEQTITGSHHKPILLDITLNPAADKRPVILYAHGFNGFKDWGNFDLIARQFVNAGFTFVKFNFSHNGTTPEQPLDFADLEAFAENNYTKELYDLEKVIDWIGSDQNPFAAYIDHEQLGLIGHSMGGGISILKAAEDRRIQALATWAAIDECKTPWTHWPQDKLENWKDEGVAYYFNGRTQQQMPMHYQLYEDFQQHSDRLDIINAAGKIAIPWLICHGLSDTSVSVESAYSLHRACPQATLFTPDSDHVFGRKHPWQGDTLPDAMQEVLLRNIAFFLSVFKK
ncbi:alpha/beta hydrolase family protein [Taibaiella koreensis]|uniref:alpha/beta hydrolase family protein n=1 Tax=Taibaiella koreensis TaxID=1268548 RepID=UPI000E59F1E5|nr:alpha/beta fold hydrolase [Taibaiella koreensis]